LVEIVLFERGWVTLSPNFRGKGTSSSNEFWRQKARVPVVCVILRLAVLIQYRHVTYRHTQRQTHDNGYYPRIASAARVKNWRSANVNKSNVLWAFC